MRVPGPGRSPYGPTRCHGPPGPLVEFGAADGRAARTAPRWLRTFSLRSPSRKLWRRRCTAAYATDRTTLDARRAATRSMSFKSHHLDGGVVVMLFSSLPNPPSPSRFQQAAMYQIAKDLPHACCERALVHFPPPPPLHAGDTPHLCKCLSMHASFEGGRGREQIRPLPRPLGECTSQSQLREERGWGR